MSSSGQHLCRACGQVLNDPFYRANDRPVCAKCAEQFRAGNAVATNPRRTGAAILTGLLAALVMGYLFAAGWNYTSHFLWPLFTIVMGYAIGWTMQRASGRQGGELLRWIGVLFGGASVFLGEVILALLWPDNFSTGIEGGGIVNALKRTIAAWGFLDWIYVLIAAWEPYLMIRTGPQVEVTGPFPLASLEPVKEGLGSGV